MAAPQRFVIPRAKRGIQYAAASRFHHWRLGVLDHPLSRVMTVENVARVRTQMNSHAFQFQTAPTVIASEAKQSIEQRESKYGLLRGACHRARIRATRWLAMTAKHNSAISRRDAPEFCKNLRPGGRGERRVPNAPAASRGIKNNHTSIVTTGSPDSPGFPHAMVLTVASCSSRRSGLFVTVANDVATVDLTPASRRQNHTTSPSAS